MGLDIYCYRYEDFDRTRALEQAAEERADRWWAESFGEGADYNKVDPVARDAHFARVRAANEADGLDEYGSDETTAKKIELPSPTHPNHMYKIGYFRRRSWRS